VRQRRFEIEHALKPAAIRKNRARLICCEQGIEQADYLC
jgi:hypothetical protein